jgi:GMP synthase-like glutamine amidotransferase
MICLVSLEHESWLANPETRASHLAHCMDVKLKVESMTGWPCLVQRYPDITQEGLEGWGIEALLISGNATEWEYYAQHELAGLKEIIRRAELPILGFCGGLQIMAMAYSVTVAPMRRLKPGEPDVTTLSAPGYLKEWGFMPVDVVEADPIFDGLEASPVFLEAHNCEVKEVPPGFRVLASSKDCPIQALKQNGKPVYGVQFHPESYTEKPYDQRNPLVNVIYPDGYPRAEVAGRELIANFFRIAGVLN